MSKRATLPKVVDGFLNGQHMRILLASEEVTAIPEDALLVFTKHLCRWLAGRHDLTVLHASGEPEEAFRSLRLLSPRFLFSRGLVRLLRRERFDLVLYIPSSGLTACGLARALLLRAAAGASLCAFALQERGIGPLHRLLSRIRRPELVFSPLAGTRDALRRIGIMAETALPGYDDEAFAQVDAGRKAALRRKYNLPADRWIVLHVGHVKESRNLQVFLRWREWGADVLPVVKSGETEPGWASRLRRAGGIVIDEHLQDIHELYQLADCYLFPSPVTGGGPEFPLSVVEAAACGLPVATTSVGALPGLLEESPGFVYIDGAADIPAAIARFRAEPPPRAADVRDLSWNDAFSRSIEPHLARLAEAGDES